jgi:hypothetical protein
MLNDLFRLIFGRAKSVKRASLGRRRAYENRKTGYR